MSAARRSRSRLTSAGSVHSQWRNSAPSSGAPVVEDMSMGMGWLYSMVSGLQMAGKTGYSDASRQWLCRRVNASDMELQRRSARASVWWEDDEPMPVPSEQLTLDDNDDVDDESDDSDDEVEPSKLSSEHKEQSYDHMQHAAKLSLKDILDSALFRQDFRQHLEEHYCEQGLDFLEEHSEWRQIDVRAYPRKVIKNARGLYERFVDPNGDRLVSVPMELRKKLEKVTASALERYEAMTVNADLFKEELGYVTDTLEETRQQVMKHMESVLYPRFTSSDDYKEMLAVHLDADTEVASATDALNKSAAWTNSKGYKSVRVELTEAEDLPLAPGRKAWALVTCDSRTYQSDEAPQLDESEKEILHMQDDKDPEHDYVIWKDAFEFPIATTTQYVKVAVYTMGLVGTHHLGRCIIPIAHIQSSSEASGGSELFPLLPKTRGEAVAGAVRLDFKLSKDEANETKHKLVVDDDEKTGAVVGLVRGLVSKKKRRYKADGFDLDLTYVTDRIIAMGFPSESLEGVYRNNMKDVQRFFERRHPKTYKIYNLCSERSYDPAKFKGRVARYPFDDHNPPPMTVLKAFCKDMHQWLSQHPQHVAAVHCKAGKGRTGTVIAAYFVYAGMLPGPDPSLLYFARKRTQNSKGVTIPSQMRYVNYFSHYCKLRRLKLPPPPKQTLLLQRVVLHNAPPHLMSGDIWFTITQNGRKALMFKSKGTVTPSSSALTPEEVATIEQQRSVRAAELEAQQQQDDDNNDSDKKKKKKKKQKKYKPGPLPAGHVVFDFGNRPMLLSEDIRVEFYAPASFSGKDKLFQTWLNSSFVDSMYRCARGPNAAEFQYHKVAGVLRNRTASELDNKLRHQLKKHKQKCFSLILDKLSVDKVCKDKKHKHYPPEFTVEYILTYGAERDEAPAPAAAVTPAVEHKKNDDQPVVVSTAAASASSASSADAKSTDSDEKPKRSKSKGKDKKKTKRAKSKGKDKTKTKKAQPVLKIGNLLSVRVPKKK